MPHVGDVDEGRGKMRYWTIWTLTVIVGKMFENRRDAAEADEGGGGRRE